MKKIVFLFLLSSFLIKAQTYSISPAKTVTFSAAMGDITAKDIYQVNTGSTSITLLWEGVSVNLPALWEYSICDFGACYPGVPAGPNAMNTVAVGGQGFLGLNINPGVTPGTGNVKVFVYQSGYKANGDTLTWYVNANWVGIAEESKNSGLSVFPNPATDQLHINSANFELTTATISDALGRNVLNVSLFSNTNTVDISGLQKGYYTLCIATKNEQLYRRIIKE
jgi:hypothetical protein